MNSITSSVCEKDAARVTSSTMWKKRALGHAFEPLAACLTNRRRAAGHDFHLIGWRSGTACSDLSPILKHPTPSPFSLTYQLLLYSHLLLLLLLLFTLLLLHSYFPTSSLLIFFFSSWTTFGTTWITLNLNYISARILLFFFTLGPLSLIIVFVVSII